MGLFKSKDERRIEREMKIRAGLKSIDRAIRQQQKQAEEFIQVAQQARRAGDTQQYNFTRSALKRSATLKRMLERQLIVMKNAMLIGQQAESARQFAESMTVMSKQIAAAFGDMDLTKTQADWEKAVNQSTSMQERMDLLLDSMQQQGTEPSVQADAISDDEIDRMIDAETLAAERSELSKLDEIESEINKELGRSKE